MIPVNEYFGGKVKSLTLSGATGKETLGVMQPGEYEFSTTSREIITVVSGAMLVKLPESTQFEIFYKGDIFEVEANVKFHLRIHTDAAYHCLYI
ncbi:MAG: pyrimidine/purine nucleoside phosphorylase [Cytophagales bacterium]|nr:pyrimidine/purine nucleoside phosphorylase [Cytophagales bacterium]